MLWSRIKAVGGCFTIYFSPLAQLVERSTVNRKVTGSSPVRRGLPQWRNWISRLTSNQKAVGSSPTWGASVVLGCVFLMVYFIFICVKMKYFYFILFYSILF